MLGKPNGVKKSLFTIVSDFTLRHSDLTVVTNAFLANLVHAKGGRAFVLQDAMPGLSAQEATLADSETVRDFRQGFFVCTYAQDEPYEMVFEAAASLEIRGRLVVSGRPPRTGFRADVARWIEDSDIIELAGFLPDADYVRTMQKSDFVVALTTSEHCLVCAAYEAFSLGKPLILSDTQALREYFGTVPMYVENSVEGLRRGLEAAFSGAHPTPTDVVERRQDLESEWRERFESLVSAIHKMVPR